MKIEEKFYTISNTEMKNLCRKFMIYGHANGFNEYLLEDQYLHHLSELEDRKRIGFLTFRANVNEIN